MDKTYLLDLFGLAVGVGLMLVATSPTSVEPNAPEEDKKHPVAAVEQRLDTCRASPKAPPDVSAALPDCPGEPPSSSGTDLRQCSQDTPN
jgi:hypothetical protein